MKGSVLLKTMAVLVAGYISWSAAGCGGTVCENPPDVEGTYDLTDIDAACSGFFDTVITVAQSECNVSLNATTAGFLDADGTIDDNGNFEVSNANGTCEGDFAGDTGTATCTNNDGDSCNLTYERR